MVCVVIGESAKSSLSGVTERAELRDEHGNLLGYFTPAARALYGGVDAPISDEELARRRQEPGGRTLAEVLADLEQRG